MDAYYPRAIAVLDVLLEDFSDGSGSELPAVEAVPRTVEVRCNDHRTADTFRLELDYRDFPFDPRMLRAIHVRIFMGDVEDPAAELTADDKFWRFAGFVDVPRTQLQDGGEVVTLEGRDYTGPFLDTRWSGAAIDVTGSLSDVVRGIVGTVEGTEGLEIGFSQGAAELVLADLIGRTKFSARAGDDVWTVLVDLCGRAGLIPVIQLDMLLVLKAEDFGVSRQDFMSSGTFTPQKAAFLYGENLTRLEFRRNFVEARTMQIEVRAWDEAKRTARSARFPSDPIIAKKRVSTKGKVTEVAAPILPYFVSGSYTDKALAELAESIYTEAARQQVEGTLETREMVDLDGSADLPGLANGDRITVTLGTALLADIAGMSEAEAVSFLTGGTNPMDPAVAKSIVTAFTRAQKLAVEFYVREATHKWSRDDGYALTVDFINFVGGGS